VPQLGDISPKLRAHIGQIAPRRDVAHAGIHLMHPIHKLGALLSPEGLLELLGQPRRDGHATT